MELGTWWNYQRISNNLVGKLLKNVKTSGSFIEWRNGIPNWKYKSP